MITPSLWGFILTNQPNLWYLVTSPHGQTAPSQFAPDRSDFTPWHNLVSSAYMLSSIGMNTTCNVQTYVDSSLFFGTTQGTRELNLSNLFILKKLNATLTELFVSFYKVLYHSCISELTAKRPELLSPTFVIKTVLLLLFSRHACCPRVMCRQMLI